MQLQQEHLFPGGKQSSFPAGSDSWGRLCSYWAGRELKPKVKRKKGKRELNSAVPSPSWCTGTQSPYLCEQVRNSPVMYLYVHLGLSLFWLPGCGECCVKTQPRCLFLLLPFVMGACPPECPSAGKGAAEATRGEFCQSLEQAIRTTLVHVFCQTCLNKHKFIEGVGIFK